MTSSDAWVRILAISLASLTGGACAYSGRLAEFDFRDSTIGTVPQDPGMPELVDLRDGSPPDWVNVEDEDDLEKIPGVLDAALWLAAEVSEAIEVGDAEVKLAEVPLLTDVASVLAAGVLRGAGKELGSRVISDDSEADYALLVSVLHYGLIVAESWEETGFVIEARVELVHRELKELIWTTDVDVTDAAAGDPVITNSTANSFLVVGDLSEMSPQHMADALNALAERAAEIVLEALRKSVEAARKP